MRTTSRCLGLVFAGMVFAATVVGQQRSLRVYTAADGLGHNSVRHAVHDSKGFLWFCTGGGLTRFDGQHFVNFGSGEGAPFVAANDLLELSDGSYWIASDGQGLIRFNANSDLQQTGTLANQARFKVYSVPGGPAANRIEKLALDKAGTLWLATDGGLFRARELSGRLEIQPVALRIPGRANPQMWVYTEAIGPDGSIYAGTEYGLVRLWPGGARTYYQVQADPALSGIFSLVFHDSALWIGHRLGLFVLCPALTAPKVDFEQDLSLNAARKLPFKGSLTQPGQAAYFAPGLSGAPDTRVTAVGELSGGRVWFASESGVYEYKSGDIQRILPNGPFRLTIDIQEDSMGNIWLESDISGVARLQATQSTFLGPSDGIDGLVVGAFNDRAGELVVSSRPQQLTLSIGGKFVSFPLHLAANAVISLGGAVIQDHLGDWWVGTVDGIYRFRKTARLQDLARADPIAVYTRAQGLSDNEAYQLFEDSRGDVWISRQYVAPVAPLSRWDRAAGRFVNYSSADGLPEHNFVSSMAEDRRGQVWFGFKEGGIARYRDGKFQRFSEAEGLPSGSVRGLAVDAENRLWCAIGGHGLVRLDSLDANTVQPIVYSTREGLSSNTVDSIFVNEKGRIYAGSPKGVDKLDPASGAIRHYGAAEGFIGEDVNTICGDGRGGVWTSTRSRVVRLAGDSSEDPSPTPVLISGLSVAGVGYQVPALGARKLSLNDLPYQRNSMQLDFLRQAFAGQTPVFQYKLEGATDSDWSLPTTVGTVNYADLAPGRYKFLVRQAALGSEVGPGPAELSFRIVAPFWRRWWFIASVLFLVMGALFAFERYRAAKVKQLRSSMAALGRANEALGIEFAVSRIMAESSGKDILPNLLQTLCEKTGWQRAALWEIDRESGVLHDEAEWPEAGASGGSIRLPGKELPGQAVHARRAVWIEEPVAHAAFPIFLENLPLGALEFSGTGPIPSDAAQIDTLTTVCGLIGQWLERMHAKQALRASEVRFRTLAETASDAIITINESGNILFCNPSAADVFGYPLQEMMGRDLTMLMPARMRESHKNGLRRYLATGDRNISWKAVELPGLHASGNEISLELSFGEFTLDRERFFTAVVRDVTERKKAEETIRRSREERLADIERMRRRIATDLHDDIGSSLTQISVLSEVARLTVSTLTDHSLERPLEIIASSSRELIESMSDIVWAINPQRDKLTDLTHRMRRFAADTLTARDIEFTLQLPDQEQDMRLEGNLRREVFLIFKEALNNAVRHSDCTSVHIEMRLEVHGLYLLVRDNGKGFDRSNSEEGHGLASMSGRAAGIGATLEVRSVVGDGVCVTLELPLTPPASV